MKRERSIHLGENEDNKQSQSDSYQPQSDLKQEEKQKMFGRGLDVGTGLFCSAYYENDEVQTLLIRDAFTIIDADKHKLKMIKDRNEDFILKDDKIYLIGEKAKVYSNIFGSRYPLRRPLAKGVLNPEEKDSHFVVREILKSILGSPKVENEIVYFSVPAEPLDATFNQIFHENKFISLLDGLGFDGRPINEAKCVIYAEGSDSNYSGIAISFGAGMCLSGDTKIPLLDGSVETMEELSKKYSNKKFWIFSCLEDGTIVPALAWNPHKVKNAEIMRLWFDNGKFLDCTKDHKIMMRDGTYKEAQFLKEKDSLMPLYLSDVKEAVLNHKITKVEYLHKNADVYDMTVDKYHNFVIESGIFVHNCNFALSFENDSNGLEFSLTKPGKDITKDESYGCGDWIDKNAALAIGKEVHEIIDIKEEFDSNGKQKLDLINPETEEHFAIAVYYKNLIRYVVANIKNGIDNLKNIPRISQPIPIFITGGTSMAPGFIQLFESEWKKYKWPFEISEIKHVDPLRTVATGALVAAISEY